MASPIGGGIDRESVAAGAANEKRDREAKLQLHVVIDCSTSRIRFNASMQHGCPPSVEFVFPERFSTEEWAPSQSDCLAAYGNRDGTLFSLRRPQAAF